MKQLRIFDAAPISVVGVDAHIDPAGCTGFTEIFGEFVTSHWADRVVGPYGEASMHTYPVGADDSVRPQNIPLFTEIFGEFVTSQRADVGIGPYNGARVQNTTQIRIIYTIVPPAMDRSILTATNSRLPP